MDYEIRQVNAHDEYALRSALPPIANLGWVVQIPWIKEGF